MEEFLQSSTSIDLDFRYNWGDRQISLLLMATECGNLPWVVLLLQYGVTIDSAVMTAAEEAVKNNSETSNTKQHSLILRIMKTHNSLQQRIQALQSQQHPV